MAFGSSMHNNRVLSIKVEDGSGSISSDLNVTVWYDSFFLYGGIYGAYTTGALYGLILAGAPIPFKPWNVSEFKNGGEVKNYDEVKNSLEFKRENG